jgi:hypothetical protein
MWSRTDMLGDQSCFMNALMTCLEDGEEMVTLNSLVFLLLFFYLIHSFFIAKMILILPSLIEKIASEHYVTIRLHLLHFFKLVIQLIY